MNRKYFLFALFITTTLSFILNLSFLSLLDTNYFESARRLFGTYDNYYQIYSLQNTSLVFFFFILFYFSAKVDIWVNSLSQNIQIQLSPFLFNLGAFILLLLPILFYSGTLASRFLPPFFVTIIKYFTLCCLVISCSILIYHFNNENSIIESFKYLALFSISATIVISILQLSIIGVLVSFLNISIDSSELWPSDNIFWQDLFIQPLILLISFGLGLFTIKKFQRRNVLVSESA